MTKHVAKRTAAVEKMLAESSRGRALMGGTLAMREAGEAFLPRFNAEDHENYRSRLQGSWLFNGFRKTVRDMTGRVFAKPVELGDGASAQMRLWMENADLAGHDLSVFARRVFEDALSGPGVSYIMVDAPPRAGTETQAEATARGLRPYLIHLRVEDILGWQTEVIGAATVLQQLRIMEAVVEPHADDPFAQTARDRVRVLTRTESGVTVELYRRVAKDLEQWELEAEPIITGLPEITVAPVYLNRTGFFTGAMLLDDLADVNIAHWQSQSDQRNILQAARVPILFASGFPEDAGPLVIGSKKAITAMDPAAELRWIEHSGAAIGAGRQDLKDLEMQMEALGLQLLTPRPNAQSATGEAIDAAKETTQLAMAADALQDALEMAMIWVSAYAGEASSPAVTVNKDFGAAVISPQELTVMLNAVNTGNLSRATFIEELARRGVIRPEITPEEEEDRIDATAPAATGAALDLTAGA